MWIIKPQSTFATKCLTAMKFRPDFVMRGQKDFQIFYELIVKLLECSMHLCVMFRNISIEKENNISKREFNKRSSTSGQEREARHSCSLS